ncbi:SirB2 family protein [Marinobacter sp. ANT_B65]|uniref:SirB2 family protein n=1 Tax=Marinobacter sp. ANT_B65 TaxID=2039467 RepID=UPI000BBEA0ED|nr:SirB2 family protein [Marinobacter sp. ANT_B65]PCM44744.1 invasion protein [Marinobacter sp. ANT_B65]
MSTYVILKHLHMTAAYLTITLFMLRLLLDLVGRPGWRQTPLRWIPHANDTVLLVAAISLLFAGGWNPLEQSWLMAKILLLLGYIAAGLFALKVTISSPVRVAAAALALLQVSFIFYLAMSKPVLF